MPLKAIWKLENTSLKVSYCYQYEFCKNKFLNVFISTSAICLKYWLASLANFVLLLME